jgi:hypothetical protein
MTTNEEIAELLGWKHQQHKETLREQVWLCWHWENPDGDWYDNDDIVPDWLHSLDLVRADLESVLTDEEWHGYSVELAVLVNVKNSGSWDVSDFGVSIEGDTTYALINAAAAVKCEAWVNVMRNRKDR